MRSLKHKKVLVFGGSGFLGSHLVKRLFQLQAYPAVADLKTKVDITNSSQVNRLVRQDWDTVLNLAGLSGTVSSQSQIQKSFLSNVIGSINILETARKLAKPPILFFSNSRQEYGQPQCLPVDENHPINPTNLYGVHKSAVTQLVQLYFKTYHLPTIVFRTSNVYGPSPDKSQHDYNLVNQWINNGPITIFGTGRQKRDYLFIDDWVNAVIAALTAPKAYGQIFNIGSGQGQSLLSMAETIAKLTGAKVVHKPWPKDFKAVETGSYISDITKAKRILHWQPQTDFIAGVKKALHETTT